jgi:tetratricopeptide (TPR) repeat protein
VTPDEAYAESIVAAKRALALDADLGEAHSVLALLKMAHDYDWTGSEAEFKRALELSPGSADIYDYYGWLCGSLERYDEALEFVRRAQELDPLTHRSDVASMLLRAGLYEEALATAQRAAEFEPNYSRVRSTLGWAHLKLGNVDAGLSNLEHAVKMDPENTLFQAQLGQAYAMYGKPDEARAVLQRLETWTRERYVSPYHLAYVYTGLGDFDHAIDLLERSYRERAGAIYGVKGSFLFTSLHAHPRFIALLRKMNLA